MKNLLDRILDTSEPYGEVLAITVIAACLFAALFL